MTHAVGRSDVAGRAARSVFVEAGGRLSATPLVCVTVAFLATPVVVFLLAWLRAPLSWLAAGALVFASWSACRRLAGRSGGGGLAPARAGGLGGWTHFFGGAALLVLVVSTSGAGGFGPKTWDWWKHDAVLADLIAQPWPIAYRLDPPAGDLALVYYLAYYLPAALAGKTAGWWAANVALFAWTALGVVLAWQWVARLGRAAPLVAVPVVVLFTGFDVFGAFFVAGDPWWTNFHLEWWHGLFVYPGNLSLLAFAPHQALGGWLAAALSIEALRRGIRGFPHALPVCACLMWSPFAALGVAALLGAFVVIGARRRGWSRHLTRLLRAQASTATFAALAVALLLACYFAARWPVPDLPPDLAGPPAARAAAALELLPLAMGPLTFAAAWARFFGVETVPLLAALAAAAWLARRRAPGAGRFETRLLGTAAGVLALVPVVAYGYYNDWVMRVAIPALFAVQVLVARELSRAATPRWARAGLAALLLGAALFPLAQLRIQWQMVAARGAWHALAPLDEVPDLFAIQRDRAPHYGFVEQYLARASAPFFRYLSPPPAPRPIATADDAPQGTDASSRGQTQSN